MVIEGLFERAVYGPAKNNRTSVTVHMELNNAELAKLQSGLACRRMDLIQMVINSSAVVAVNPGDTPTTSTESW